MAHNALRAAAVWVLLVCCFDFVRHLWIFTTYNLETRPTYRLRARCTKSRPGITPGTG
jgi:hypothetical protein